MPKKYRRVTRQSSRLETQQTKNVMRQTYLILAATFILIILLIFVGIPALIKIAVFLGDLRSSSDPIEQSDTIPPQTPQLTTPPVATTSAKINITGFAESGSTVVLYQNNAKNSETIAEKSGSFKFTSIKLDSGTNRFSVKAIDLSGNESPLTSVATVNFDSSAPDISITSPSNNDHFYGPSERTVTIKGETDAESTVTINDRLAVVNNQGQFSIDIQLEEGDNTINATSTDQAGNTSTQTIQLKYSK